jgi:hypothetical protein
MLIYLSLLEKVEGISGILLIRRYDPMDVRSADP